MIPPGRLGGSEEGDGRAMKSEKSSSAAATATFVRSRMISRPSLHDRVVDQLREMIVHGELAPGTRIIETELSSTLGISRTPLREALKILALDGLIEILPHKGARVTLLTVDESESLFDVIAALEGLAAEQTASGITDDQLDELEAMHDRMAFHFQRRERDDYFGLNTEIHARLVALADNDVLKETHTRLMLRASRGRYVAIFEPARWEQAMAEHDMLMEALRKRDASAAGRIWRKHLLRTGEAVSKALMTSETATRSKASA